jgi:hypothetical protein
LLTTRGWWFWVMAAEAVSKESGAGAVWRGSVGGCGGVGGEGCLGGDEVAPQGEVVGVGGGGGALDEADGSGAGGGVDGTGGAEGQFEAGGAGAVLGWGGGWRDDLVECPAVGAAVRDGDPFEGLIEEDVRGGDSKPKVRRNFGRLAAIGQPAWRVGRSRSIRRAVSGSRRARRFCRAWVVVVWAAVMEQPRIWAISVSPRCS